MPVPVWTSWARPIRTPRHFATRDNLYICREDGLVIYLEIDQDLPILIRTSRQTGIVHSNINTAFASVDTETYSSMMGEEVLIVGGNKTPGGIYWVGIYRPNLGSPC